jgi:hypothetical protein
VVAVMGPWERHREPITATVDQIEPAGPPVGQWSIAPAQTCNLYHACLFTWLNGGVAPIQVAG